MTKRKGAKDGADSVKDEVHALMLKRFDLCNNADETTLRDLAAYDIRFVNVRGAQWDENQRALRKGRPCYEFDILRQQANQITNDQRQARPSIKIRATENNDKKDAEIRQGIIRNIESVSNAERAYDTGFKCGVDGGFGVWGVSTRYAEDMAFEQEIYIEEKLNPFSVWFDPSAKEYDRRDGMFAFEETEMSRETYEARYPDKPLTDWDSSRQTSGWFSEHKIRLVRYWVKKPIKKTIVLLSNGKTVNKDEQFLRLFPQLEQEGITIKRERTYETFEVCSYLANGSEFISGPHPWAGKFIPLIPFYGNLLMVDGREQWFGFVRHAIDAQKILNYNITTAQEVLAKQPKSPVLLTLQMLQGEGVKPMWDNANAVDAPYLAYTPDPLVPGGPRRERPADFPAAFTSMGQVSTDLLKSVTGVNDAVRGLQTNETSGKAILARQRQGDNANFNYQDNLSRSIQFTGEIILDLLPHIYDTERVMRILGEDGAEDYVTLNQAIRDPQTGEEVVLNDLSKGKFDVTVSTGPSFSSQRQEFTDFMMSMSQSNPELFAIGSDLVFEAMDMPFSDKFAERAKAMLPPPIQQLIGKDKKMPPEVQQGMAQVEQAMQKVQEQSQAMQQEAARIHEESMKLDANKAQISADLAKLQSADRVMRADFDKMKAQFELMQEKARNEMLQSQTQDGQVAMASITDFVAQQAEQLQQNTIAIQQLGDLVQSLMPQEQAEPPMDSMPVDQSQFNQEPFNG